MTFQQAIQLATVTIRNLLWGGNLAALSLCGKPQALLAYINESLSLHKALTRSRGIPERSVVEALGWGNIESVTLGHLNQGDTWFDKPQAYAADLISLCLICRILKPRVVFEIGTLGGYTTLHFALNTPEETRIYTLDFPKGPPIRPALPTTRMDDIQIAIRDSTTQHYFDGTPAVAKIVRLYGDSAIFDFSPFHGKVDFFFIDGAHSYEYVRSDTLHAFRCCHPQSLIAWHDFGRVGVNGVSRWLRELARDHEVRVIPGGSLAYLVVK